MLSRFCLHGALWFVLPSLLRRCWQAALAVLIIFIFPTLPVVIALFPYDPSELNQTQKQCWFSPLHLSSLPPSLSLLCSGMCFSLSADIMDSVVLYSLTRCSKTDFTFHFVLPAVSLRPPQYHRTKKMSAFFSGCV